MNKQYTYARRNQDVTRWIQWVYDATNEAPTYDETREYSLRTWNSTIGQGTIHKCRTAAGVPRARFDRRSATKMVDSSSATGAAPVTNLNQEPHMMIVSVDQPTVDKVRTVVRAIKSAGGRIT